MDDVIFNDVKKEQDSLDFLQAQSVNSSTKENTKPNIE